MSDLLYGLLMIVIGLVAYKVIADFLCNIWERLKP